MGWLEGLAASPADGGRLVRPFGLNSDHLVRASTRFSWGREVDHLLLPPRDVRVWLPPDYTGSDAAHPVLICHDGQHVIPEPGSGEVAPRSWHLGRTLTRLCRADAFTRTPIVVLVDNCHSGKMGKERLGDLDLPGMPLMRRRWVEYGDTPIGHRYIDWLVDELKPSVDAAFHTAASETYLMGSSMGGTSAFLGLWRRPDVIAGAACLSPVFHEPLIADVRRRASERFGHTEGPPRLYIDNGGATAEVGVSPLPLSLQDGLHAGWWWLDTSLQPGVDAMREALASHALPYDYHRDPGGRHNEAAWAARVERPLRYLFGREEEQP
jgi:enterochelin esterase-like enzyme